MRRREVVIAPEARDDLLDLYERLSAEAGRETALAYVERIEVYCAGFDLAAERGRRRDDLRPGLRVVGFARRATIAFAVTDERVTILRVFAGGRDWTSEL